MKLVIVESPTKVPPSYEGEDPRFSNRIKNSEKIGTKTIS